MTRDELVECTALLARRSAPVDLDAVAPTGRPARRAGPADRRRGRRARTWQEDELFALVRAAAPYATLTGAALRRGRRPRRPRASRPGAVGGAHTCTATASTACSRAPRGARLAALTSGGAIPELGDYRSSSTPTASPSGSVHEDFAIEATAGDVFLLGTHSWRVLQVETGTVRVADADGTAPTIPFWLGEAPARTAELSAEVVRAARSSWTRLASGDADGARLTVASASGVSHAVAEQVVAYLDARARRARRRSRPRDSSSSSGSSTRPGARSSSSMRRTAGGSTARFGLALRKRFCVTLRLRAPGGGERRRRRHRPRSAALASLSSEVAGDAPRRHGAEVLTQAVLPLPMLAARWRWNVARALVMPRSTSGGRRPIHLQRMEADDLMAATWPALAACQENAPAGPIPVPDHPLVRQTVDDCLFEATRRRRARWRCSARSRGGTSTCGSCESTEPSRLAHGILNGAP